MRDCLFYPRAIGEIIRVLGGSGLWSGVPAVARTPVLVDRDFFGINVAGSPDEAVNEASLAYLDQLGLKQVRIDLSRSGLGRYPEHFIRQLLRADYRVFVRLVQPVDEAARMEGEDAQLAWRDFLPRVQEALPLASFEAVEIGAVPNRRTWSGYSHRGYLNAWTIAADVLGKTGVALAGPNVSDFEPLHTIGLLKGMQRTGRVPDIQTNNLFVERTRIPEAFDHRVMGGRMADRLKLNLIKKAGIFKALSDRYDIPRTMCTHTCWNGLRLLRWTPDIEPLRAEYLRRYLLLAIASGALDRVYWGPMIGTPDGLIDDGTGVVQPIERVAFYERCFGKAEDFRVLPAFEAYRVLIAELSGAELISADVRPEACAFTFKKADGSSLDYQWINEAVLP
ncbi:MAG: hypothetical protein ACI9TH_002097 [Kiritimatiellia bacterium]|jgi:hypothetical protein